MQVFTSKKHPLFVSIWQIFEHKFASENKVFGATFSYFSKFLEICLISKNPQNVLLKHKNLLLQTRVFQVKSTIIALVDRYPTTSTKTRNKFTNKKFLLKTINFCSCLSFDRNHSCSVAWNCPKSMWWKWNDNAIFASSPSKVGGYDLLDRETWVAHFHGWVAHFRGWVAHFQMAFHLHHLQTCFHAVATGLRRLRRNDACLSFVSYGLIWFAFWSGAKSPTNTI